MSKSKRLHPQVGGAEMSDAKIPGRTTKKKGEPALKNTIAPAKKRDVRDMPTIMDSEPGILTLGVKSEDTMIDLWGMKTRAGADGVGQAATNALGGTNMQHSDFIFAMAAEMEPSDAVEAMLIGQMAATHMAWSTASRRMADSEDMMRYEAYERAVTKLSRTYLAQMDALKKYRAKAQQTVRVERVTVNEGGQAIVGSVHAGGRGGDEK